MIFHGSSPCRTHYTRNKKELGFRSRVNDEPIYIKVIIRDSQTELVIPGATVEYFIESLGRKGSFLSRR